MSKKLVDCPAGCGVKCKEGTGLATHLKQWCKKAPGSQRYEGPKVPELDGGPITAPDMPTQDPTTPEATNEEGPEICSGPPKPSPPTGGQAKGPGHIAAVPPQAQAQTIEPDAAPPFDWKKNGPILVVIAVGIICVIVGTYLWVRQGKKKGNQSQEYAQAVGMVQTSPGVWEYMPGGGR
jgi:hypothetical protein